MKRVLLTAAVALLIPSLVGAWTPTLGVYIDGKLTYTPAGPFTPFLAHLVIVQSELYVTGVEYSLVTPNDPYHGQFIIESISYPPNFSLQLGDPWIGHAITFWPPLTGYPEGYDVMATYHCLTLVPCAEMWDYPIVVSPDPTTGELRGAFAPNNDLFDIIGLTSYLCIDQIAVEEESWGAIKSMYR
jgi:hypothetical protein